MLSDRCSGRDLDKDIEERRKRRGKQTQPMSLWEELSDIGEGVCGVPREGDWAVCPKGEAPCHAVCMGMSLHLQANLC